VFLSLCWNRGANAQEGYEALSQYAEGQLHHVAAM
jgi:hypothetical protein